MLEGPKLPIHSNEYFCELSEVYFNYSFLPQGAAHNHHTEGTSGPGLQYRGRRGRPGHLRVLHPGRRPSGPRLGAEAGRSVAQREQRQPNARHSRGGGPSAQGESCLAGILPDGLGVLIESPFRLPAA